MQAAKQLYYNSKMSKSTKKIKTTWDLQKENRQKPRK
jgi:hypothetical protein